MKTILGDLEHKNVEEPINNNKFSLWQFCLCFVLISYNNYKLTFRDFIESHVSVRFVAFSYVS